MQPSFAIFTPIHGFFSLSTRRELAGGTRQTDGGQLQFVLCLLEEQHRSNNATAKAKYTPNTNSRLIQLLVYKLTLEHRRLELRRSSKYRHHTRRLHATFQTVHRVHEKTVPLYTLP